MKRQGKPVESSVNVYHELVQRTAGTVGRQFFEELVRSLAEVLHSDYAFVTEFHGQPPNVCRVLAVWGDGQLGEEYEFAIPNSPAERLLKNNEVLFERGIGERFPGDVWLVSHGIEAYAAVPLLGPNGRRIGHLGVLNRAANEFPDETIAVLRVMAARAAVEYERLKAEDALQWSEAKFATAFRASPSIITISEMESGRFTDISSAFETLLGYPRETIIGRAAADIGFWNDIADRDSVVKDILTTGKAPAREVVFRHARGGLRNMLLSAELIRLDDRSYILSAMQDITEFRKTQLTLENKEQTYKALFNASKDYIFVYRVTPDGNPGHFLEANNAALKRLGYTLDELRNKTMLAMLGGKGRMALRAHFERLLQTGQMLFESSVVTRDGKEIPVESNAQVFDLDGERVVLSVARDISERQRAEAARQIQIAAMEASIDGIALLDGSLRYVYANCAHQELNGYASREDIVGRSWKDFATDEEILRFEKEVLPCFKRDGRWRGEVLSRRMDGEAYPQELSLTRIDADNVICVVRDISDRRDQERALRAAEEKYRQIFENAIDGIYRATMDHRILDANPAFAQLIGYDSPADLLEQGSKVWAKLFVDQQQRTDLLRLLEENGSYKDIEYPLQRIDGTRIWVSDNARIVRDETGSILYYEGILQDISARKAAEEALAQSEEKYRTLIDTSQDGVYIVRDGNIVYANRAMRELLRGLEGSLVGRDFPEVFHPDDQYMAASFLSEAELAGDMVRFEARLALSGDEHPCTVAVTDLPISYKGSPARTGTLRDITEQKAAEAKLLHNAFHDTLTQLPNRNLFTERLQNALDRAQRQERPAFAVLFLDLDRFKLINDSLGHEFGDHFLVQIAERLRECLRPSDLIARHGGDEFTILAEEVDGLHGAIALAERIHEQLARPFQLDRHEVFTNASIGIVMDAPHYRHPEELLRDADTAMYRAKAAGKAALAVFDDAMHEQAKAHLKLEMELRRALERNELHIYYQPIVDTNHQHIRGFEALLRWHHQEHGVLSPDAFLEIAEESGLILPIGWHVLDQACRQLAEWRMLAGCEELFINVNIANRQFSNPELAPKVREVLSRHRLPPSALRLEITETVFMDNPDIAQEILGEIKSIGVKLQMDDFGTGYSSLSGLRTFRLDTLKIDKSFVRDIAQDPGDLSIVRTIAQLSRDLKMDVVAEGVETEEQLRLLRVIGCELAQGFLFSRPLPAQDVRDWLDHAHSTGLPPVAGNVN